MSRNASTLKQPPTGSDDRAAARADGPPDGTVPDSKRPANISSDSTVGRDVPLNHSFKFWIVRPGMKDATILSGKFLLYVKKNSFPVGKLSDAGRMAIVYSVTHTIENVLRTFMSLTPQDVDVICHTAFQ